VDGGPKGEGGRRPDSDPAGVQLKGIPQESSRYRTAKQWVSGSTDRMAARLIMAR
jgi:hypothetical protein